MANPLALLLTTRGGLLKHIPLEELPLRPRGGLSVRGIRLEGSDVVEATNVHAADDTLLFVTSHARAIWRAPEVLGWDRRDARGRPARKLLGLAEDESIMSVLTIPPSTSTSDRYVVLATQSGQVKRTSVHEYLRGSQAVQAMRLSPGDVIVSGGLCGPSDDLILISRDGMGVRFTADDLQLRPQGRVTTGQRGIRLRSDDALLTMAVVPGLDDELSLFTVTATGFAKRSRVSEYIRQARGGVGVPVSRLPERRGVLVAAAVVANDAEAIAVRSFGGVTRSRVADVRLTSRRTMGVPMVSLDAEDSVCAVAVAG